MVTVHQIAPELAEHHVAHMSDAELEDRLASYEAELLPEPPSFPIEALAVEVEWMRQCDECGREVRMVADRVCRLGLIGYCAGCRERLQRLGIAGGGERIAPFTHTTTGAA